MAKVLYKLIWPAVIVECVAVVATAAYLGFRERPVSASPCQVPSRSEAVAAEPCERPDPIVCTTRGNRYYHRRSCRYVRSSKIAMPLSRAQLHRRPCSRCKPPR